MRHERLIVYVVGGEEVYIYVYAYIESSSQFIIFTGRVIKNICKAIPRKPQILCQSNFLEN